MSELADKFCKECMYYKCDHIKYGTLCDNVMQMEKIFGVEVSRLNRTIKALEDVNSNLMTQIIKITFDK